MIDDTVRERLHDCVRRESRSLLQYVCEVPLWASAADRALLDRIHDLAVLERRAVDDLGEWLQKHHSGIMHLGPYSSEFLHFNDSGIRRVLPRLKSEHSGLLDRLDADAADLAHSAAIEPLHALQAIKRRNQVDLAALAMVEPAA